MVKIIVVYFIPLICLSSLLFYNVFGGLSLEQIQSKTSLSRARPFILLPGISESISKLNLGNRISDFALSFSMAESMMYINLFQSHFPNIFHEAYASSDFLGYESPAYNLKMQYPSSWQKVEHEGNVTFLSPIENNSDLIKQNLSIATSPSGNVPLLKHVSLDIIEFRQHLSDFKPINSVTHTIAGNPAYKIVYTYKNNNKSYTVMKIWTIVEGKAYLLTYQAESEKYSGYLPIIERMLDSIDIAKTKIPTKNNIKNPELEISQDPYEIIVNQVTNTLYITNLRYHTVSVVDGSNDRVRDNIKVGSYPEGLDVTSDTNMVYVANSRSNTVSVIDGSTNNVVSNIPVGQKPNAVVVDTDERGLNSLIFVVNSDSNTVSVIDAKKNQVIYELKVGVGPGSIAVNPIINRLYVLNSDSNTVSVIDYFISEGGKFQNTTIADIKVGHYPTSIALNQNTNRLYIANSDSNTVSVIDGSTNKIIYDIPVGVNPYDIAINEKINRLYVANYGSDTVSVIDGSTNNVVSNIPVGSFPVGVAINPITNIIYVSNLGSNTISEINNSSIMAGITFNLNPSNSGYLLCNGYKVLNNDYIRYNVNTTITCKVNPNTDFSFRAWSGNLNLISITDPEITFKANKYGNLTADLFVPSEITLPKGYWSQLYGVLLSVMIPAFAGWFVPAIAGWINGIRQRRYLGLFIIKIMNANEQLVNSKDQYEKSLENLKDEIQIALTKGKISESQYQILNNTISYYNDLNNNKQAYIEKLSRSDDNKYNVRTPTSHGSPIKSDNYRND